MLGLGLSLLGGAVMDTPAGATAYFPAASVYHTQSTASLVLQTPYLYNVPAAAWSPAGVRARFRANITARGARHATNTFGYISGDVSTMCFVFISSQLNYSSGNRTCLEYTPASVPYAGENNPANYLVLASSTSTGDYDLKIVDNRWQLNLFGTAYNAAFATVRQPQNADTPLRQYLFGMTTVSGTFYGSYIVNTVLGTAYQCHPMRSADGKAALYEITTKRLMTDATLSAN